MGNCICCGKKGKKICDVCVEYIKKDKLNYIFPLDFQDIGKITDICNQKSVEVEASTTIQEVNGVVETKNGVEKSSVEKTEQKAETQIKSRVSELDINCPVCGLEIERNSIEKQGVIRNLNIEKSSNNKRKVVIISSIVVVFLIIVISTIVLISNREIERIDSNLPESISVQFSSSPKVIRAQTLNGTELGVSNVDSSRTFMANNTIDDNYDTCWCVNTDNTGGAGAEIAFILEEQTTIRRIAIINGNQFHTYDELYSLNGQICEFMLTFSDGSKQTFRADFNSGNPGNYQYFDIEPSVVTSSIVLTVISAYEGTKYSTNVAITEFEVY